MLATKISPFMAPDYDVFTPARRSDARGVVLGAPLDGAQAYTPWIGLSTVRELALKFPDRVGLVERERLDEAQKLILSLKNTVLQLEADIDKLAAKNERIAGLVSDGFKVQRIQGRPPKEDK
jgi:hypothetical protein